MSFKMDELFATLEAIVGIVEDISTLTQNQETVIVHSSDYEMLSELAKNKQQMILTLNDLEDRFQDIYTQNKEDITNKVDVSRLQNLVTKIVDTKASIANGEEKNRRLLANKTAPKIKVESIKQPSSYVAQQYKKHSRE